MNLKEISPELQEKLRACKTVEELTELAKAENFELSDEMLSAISGGFSDRCPSHCDAYDWYEELRQREEYDREWERHYTGNY